MRFVLSAALIAVVSMVVAQNRAPGEPEPQAVWTPMTAERLNEILMRIDPQTRQDGASWQFKIRSRTLIMVVDSNADRMRIMTPVINLADLDGAQLMRSLQANFDSALDARYAVANELVWATYIHPLSPLLEGQFLSAVAQTYTAAETFGTTYTSGALTYGGGDSAEEQRKLLEELQKKLNPTV